MRKRGTSGLRHPGAGLIGILLLSPVHLRAQSHTSLTTATPSAADNPAADNPAPESAEETHAEADEADPLDDEDDGAPPEATQFGGRPFYNVELTTRSSGRRFELLSSSRHRLHARCVDHCRVQIYAGNYYISIPASEGNAHGNRLFNVHHATTFTINDADRGLSRLGLGIGIGGIVLFAFSGLSRYILNCGPHGCGGELSPAHNVLSIVGMSLGGVMIPTGWALFALNRKPDVVEAARPVNALAVPIFVGVQALPGGAGASLAGRF